MHIVSNKLKTGLIVVLIAVFFAAAIYYISVWAGMDYNTAVLMSLALSLMFSIGSYFFSDKIVIKSTGAREATPDELAILNPMIARLAEDAKVPMPKIYVMDDMSLNAFATGRNHKHSLVCVTKGIMQALQPYELEGVLAHEMAHIKNYDILLQTVASVMIGAVIIAANSWRNMMFFRRSGSRDRENGSNAIIMIIGLVFVILAPLAGQLLRMALSRNREYLADATGAGFTKNPEGLASALEKLSLADTRVKTANNATEGLYIVNSLNAKNIKNIFSTHPPIEKRIERLRSM